MKAYLQLEFYSSNELERFMRTMLFDSSVTVVSPNTAAGDAVAEAMGVVRDPAPEAEEAEAVKVETETPKPKAARNRPKKAAPAKNADESASTSTGATTSSAPAASGAASSKETSSSKVTKEDVHAALKAVADYSGLTGARSLLTEFAVGRAGELPEEKYAAFVKRANEKLKKGA